MTRTGTERSLDLGLLRTPVGVDNRTTVLLRRCHSNRQRTIINDNNSVSNLCWLLLLPRDAML